MKMLNVIYVVYIRYIPVLNVVYDDVQALRPVYNMSKPLRDRYRNVAESFKWVCQVHTVCRHIPRLRQVYIYLIYAMYMPFSIFIYLEYTNIPYVPCAYHVYDIPGIKPGIYLTYDIQKNIPGIYQV
jgi:hypothetical protein